MQYNLALVLHDGDDEPYWVFKDRYTDPSEIITEDVTQATLEDLVSLCDREAEDCNAHDFCGAHRLLGAVLYNQYGRAAATATLLTIAQLGGLQGMTGVCKNSDAYAELGVGEAGRDWFGSYGA